MTIQTFNIKLLSEMDQEISEFELKRILCAELALERNNVAVEEFIDE